MHKHLFALFFLLAAAGACNTPYITKFSAEFSHPAMDPRLASITSPNLQDRLEYGVSKLICPKKPLKSLDNAASLIIESKFFKNIISEYGSLKNIDVVLDTLPVLLTNSLSKDALGYAGTKKALQSAIGAAYSSNYECSSLEKAAELYYNYDSVSYVSELCGGGDTLKTVLGLLKPAKETKLEAVDLKKELKPYFIDIFERDEVLASKIMNREMTRVSALKQLVENLKDLPLCHQKVNAYVNSLSNMASVDDPLFFSLYDAVVEFRTNCPITYSGFHLEKIEGDTLYFSDGDSTTYPFLILTPENKNLVERHPKAPFKVNISGIAPISTDDEYFDTSVIPPNKGARLNAGRLAIIALFGVILTGLWLRAKKN